MNQDIQEKLDRELCSCAGRKDLEGLLKCLDQGANIEARNGNGDTPFLLAIETSSEQVPKDLAKRGADVHATNNEGDNALHIIAHWGYFHLVSWVLDVGVDPEQRNKQGKTPTEVSDEIDDERHRRIKRLIALHLQQRQKSSAIDQSAARQPKPKGRNP